MIDVAKLDDKALQDFDQMMVEASLKVERFASLGTYLWQEVLKEKVRVTSIEHGAVESDLKFTTSGTAAETVLDFYKQAIPAASVARAIAFAVEQPDDVDVNAIVIRPTAQEF